MMNRTVLEAAASGDESLIQGLEEHSIDPHQVTSQIMNTILHISVSFNQMGISKALLRLCPFLLYQANSNGETPLHIAAKIGSQEIVELLLIGDSNHDIESQQTDLLRMENLSRRDTALHVAVKNGHFAVSKLLMEKDSGLLDLVNGADESPLFLAVEGGFLDIAHCILHHFPSAPCCGSNGMNALHAAVIRTHHGQVFEHRAPDLSLEKLRRQLSGFLLHAGDQCINGGYKSYLQPTQIDIMRKLLEERRGLAEEKDAFGWTPLHCAAHLGHAKAAQLLLSNSSSTCIAYLQDKEGMSALHIAAVEGHVNVMEEILHHSPDAFDMVDSRGWTPLHVAVANEKLNVVRYILKTLSLENLINVADKEGNTPLHLAAGGDKYSIMKILVDDIRVFKKAQNLNFQKPIDLIRTNPNIGELYKSVIAKNLEKQGGLPSLRSLVHGREYGNPIKDKFINKVGYKRATHDDDDHDDEADQEVGHDHEDKEMKCYRLKNISNIHLLVASLIATVTFTAGFTMPGGYDQDQDPLRKGMALLSNKTSFQLFVVADSIAFYCSSASVFLQFCGSVEHNYHLLLRFTRVSATLTYISSLGMVVAFTSAMCAVMPNSKLADYTFVSGICCVSAYIFGFL